MEEKIVEEIMKECKINKRKAEEMLKVCMNIIREEERKMKKEDALKIILKCCKLYHSNLENKNVMFIIQDKKKEIDYLEMVFLPSNFLHLTGINIINKKIKSSTDFYNLSLKNQITTSDFEFNSNGTTSMKLQILPQIIQIQKIEKLIKRLLLEHFLYCKVKQNLI